MVSAGSSLPDKILAGEEAASFHLTRRFGPSKDSRLSRANAANAARIMMSRFVYSDDFKVSPRDEHMMLFFRLPDSLEDSFLRPSASPNGFYSLAKERIANLHSERCTILPQI